MKKTILLFFFILAFSNSCNDENIVKNTIISDAKIIELKEKADFVASEHNRMLDLLYSKLKAKQQASRLVSTVSKEDLKEESFNLSVENYSISSGDYPQLEYLIEKTLDFGFGISELSNQNIYSNYDQGVGNTALLNIINEFNVRVDMVESLQDVENLKIYIDELAVQSLSSENDILAIFSMTSTAVHSWNYWNANFDDWGTLINPSNPPTNTVERHKRACKADANGIIQGMVGGAIFGAITGGPAGALIGGVTSGIVGGFVASAACMLNLEF